MTTGEAPERDRPGDPPRVVLRLPCRADSPAVARREIARIEDGIELALAARLRVIVTEMVSNCIWHATDGAVVVEVVAAPSLIRGEVSELDGEGEPRAPDPIPFGRAGFGRIVVRRLADRSGALDDRRGMWFELDRPDSASRN